MTGAHMAYALAMKLKKDRRSQSLRTPDTSPRSCVMYVGPSQHSVNVILGEYSFMATMSRIYFVPTR